MIIDIYFPDKLKEQHFGKYEMNATFLIFWNRLIQIFTSVQVNNTIAAWLPEG